MKHAAVNSSNLQSVGYDPTTQRMEVRFKNGLYGAGGVPAHEHHALMAAHSKGGHFHRHLRAKYDWKKL